MATITGLTPARISELISTAISTAINALTPGSIGASPSGHKHVIADITDFEGGGGGGGTPGTLDPDAPIVQNRRATDIVPRWLTSFVGDLEINNQDVAQHLINGVRASWQNEWGALRGTSPVTWGDSLVRAVREETDGIMAGRFIELVDRRDNPLPNPIYGRKWRDGMLVRNGIDMADVWIRNGQDPIPQALPENTIVVQI